MKLIKMKIDNILLDELTAQASEDHRDYGGVARSVVRVVTM